MVGIAYGSPIDAHDRIRSVRGRGSAEARVRQVEALAESGDRRRHLEVGVGEIFDELSAGSSCVESDDGHFAQLVLHDVQPASDDEQPVTIGQKKTAQINSRGLAGLRVGYALGAEYVMDAARAVAIPLSVTEPAQRAAIASLEHESELFERVAALNLVRERIVDGLAAQGWDVPAPQGNFVWLPTGEFTAEAAEVFAANGIVARALVDGLRVSVGETESVEKLLSAAEEVVRMQRTASPTAALD